MAVGDAAWHISTALIMLLGSFGGVCYRVTVVDLDCKSLRKLEGHKRLDEDIIRANL